MLRRDAAAALGAAFRAKSASGERLAFASAAAAAADLGGRGARARRGGGAWEALQGGGLQGEALLEEGEEGDDDDFEGPCGPDFDGSGDGPREGPALRVRRAYWALVARPLWGGGGGGGEGGGPALPPLPDEGSVSLPLRRWAPGGGGDGVGMGNGGRGSGRGSGGGAWPMEAWSGLDGPNDGGMWQGEARWGRAWGEGRGGLERGTRKGGAKGGGKGAGGKNGGRGDAWDDYDDVGTGDGLPWQAAVTHYRVLGRAALPLRPSGTGGVYAPGTGDGGGRGYAATGSATAASGGSVNGARGPAAELLWLELRPVTGRRHQLRAHCAAGLAAPILGDSVYDAHYGAAHLAKARTHSPFSVPGGRTV